MNTETEKIIADIKNVKNVANKHGKIVKPAVRYLRPHEEEALKEESKRYEEILAMPTWATKDIGNDRLKQMRQRQINIQQDLEENCVPRISGSDKDAVQKLCLELEGEIKQGMIPTEIMRRNPVNAVDDFRRWNKKTKDKHLMWKKCKRLLDPDSDDKDQGNIETLRPSMLNPSQSTFMVNAQIPGQMAYSNVPKENWDETFGKPNINSPLQQAEKREYEERIVALEAQVNKELKIKEQRRANMAKARKTKKQKQWQAKQDLV